MFDSGVGVDVGVAVGVRVAVAVGVRVGGTGVGVGGSGSLVGVTVGDAHTVGDGGMLEAGMTAIAPDLAWVSMYSAATQPKRPGGNLTLYQVPSPVLAQISISSPGSIRPILS